MIKYLQILLLLFSTTYIFGQRYEFETLIDIETSEVKSQGETGTCWSFATSSFLESEIVRLTGKHIDISEMYLVRNTYDQKAWNYVMRQGKIQFSEGGLAHDVINSVNEYGIVPQKAFSDVLGYEKTYNHNNLIPHVKKILDCYIKNDVNSDYPNWEKAITPILDKEIGSNVYEFYYDNKKYSPHTFRDYVKIVPEDYVSLTSFAHKKYFTSFILNIPDNFSNGSFYNLPLDMLVDIVNEALKKGFSIALDTDVSEQSFSSKYGIAVVPKKTSDGESSLGEISPEINVTAALRQSEFENYNTTDDHLMHITGLVNDQHGNKYYKVKNSWGKDSSRVGNNGYIYMSIPYFKLKAISILLHKQALPEEIQTRLKL